MKKAMIAVALVGSMGWIGAASAFDASQAFIWSGTVPPAPTTNGFVIAQPDGSAINNGVLVFHTNATNQGELSASTELRFNVFHEDGTTGQPDLKKVATNYEYKLTSLAINNSSLGLASEQDEATGYFAIQASNNGTAAKLSKNVAKTAVSGETILSVIKSGVPTVTNQPNAGDSIDVQATIVIENAA